MLGKGVKRKLSECEEPSEGLWFEEPDSLRGGDAWTRLDDGTIVCEAGESLNREMVIALSVAKLHALRSSPDPSLRLSVLVRNTLRATQGPSGPDLGNDVAVTEDTQPLLASPALTPSSVLEASMEGLALAGRIPDERAPLAAGRGIGSVVPTRVSESLSAGLWPGIEGKSGLPCIRVSEACGLEVTADMAGFLSDLTLDSVFSDIDTSMYDFDPLSSTILISSKPVTPEAFPPCLAEGGSSQACTKQELSDLDHIMQVLVGT
uniref:SERTA domain-containing protein 1-like n=1 Tax=Myxine glutinosa TaxID=7769 RepID=UPI00358F6100